MGDRAIDIEKLKMRRIERYVLLFRDAGYQLQLDSDGSWSLDFIPADADPLTRQTAWEELSRLLTHLSSKGYLLTTK